MSSKKRRPVNSGRNDSIGRPIKVSAEQAMSRSGAPPPLAAMTADELMDHIDALDEYLPEGTRIKVLVVGGANLVLRGLRGSHGVTGDIDATRGVEPALMEAARRVADDRGLAAGWINTNAAAFLPNDLGEPTVLHQTNKITVLGAAPDDVFVMKLESAASGGRAERDVPDLIALWPETSYASAQEAVDDYFARMSMAAPDDYLVEFVADIAAQASGS